MKKLWWIAAAPLLMGAGTPVDADTRKDLRCLLALSSLGDNPDKSVAIAALTGAQYFYGRIDGRTPHLDFESAMRAEAKSMVGANLKPLFQSCGATLKERGQVLVNIGKRMAAEEARSQSS